MPASNTLHRARKGARAWRCTPRPALSLPLMAIGLQRPAQARRIVPVAAGVDTLHLFTRAPVQGAWRERLEALKAEAKETDRPVVVVVAGLELRVRPYGTSAGAYLLESDLFAAKVAPAPKGEASPTVSIEVRALALWARGWRRAAEIAQDAMRELCGGVTREALRTQVTRLDVCLDFQGWEPRPEDLDRFTCRVRRSGRGRHYGLKWLEEERSIAAEKARALALLKRLSTARSSAESAEVLRELHREDVDATASTWGDQRAFTGFSFGRGVIAARLYDKTRELSVSRKGWFREVWRKGGRFDEEAPVWRLEFQLRREALVGFHEAAGGEAGEAAATWSLGDWQETADRLPALWRYLSSKWLRHGGRTAQTRQAISAPWRALQKLEESDAQLPELHREVLRESSQIVLPQVAGYLSSAAAQLVELEQRGADGEVAKNAAIPFSEAIVRVLAAAHAYAESKERPMVQRYRERRALYANRARVLNGSHRAKAARRYGQDLEVGRHQGELLTEPLLRAFGYAPRVPSCGPAQRYGESGGVLVLRDEGDDAAEATRRRKRAEEWNLLVQLRRDLAAAREIDAHEKADRIAAEIYERETRAGLLVHNGW